MTLCSRALLLSSLVIGVIGGGLPAQADPIRVSGGLVSGTAAAGVQTYKGIPYAKPPVGDLRWRAPQPVAPWSGTRVADHFIDLIVRPRSLARRLWRLAAGLLAVAAVFASRTASLASYSACSRA
jgi:hypothetical protein